MYDTLTHSLTHALTHSLTHSRVCLFVCLFGRGDWGTGLRAGLLAASLRERRAVRESLRYTSRLQSKRSCANAVCCWAMPSVGVTEICWCHVTGIGTCSLVSWLGSGAVSDLSWRALADPHPANKPSLPTRECCQSIQDFPSPD
jgi:hypothetical protein